MKIPSLLLFVGSLTCVKGILVESRNQSSTAYLTLSMPELASRCGYDLEQHEVETEDGYVLKHFRVVENNGETNEKPVVLLMHGIHTNSDTWAFHGGESLPILLARNGYDVWLGNSRGNKYSQTHKHLSAKDTAFWEHSWHEVGVHDLPASIDYILGRSGNEKLSYVGYSTGTSAFFAMLSEKPEYNEKLEAMVAYAPLVYTKNMRSPTFKFFSLFDITFMDICFKLPIMDIVTSQGPLIEFAKHVCLQQPVTQELCYRFLAFTFGPRSRNESDEMVQYLIKNLAASSLKQIVHFTQLYSSKRFQKFQYSSRETNVEKYGSPQPAEYNLKNAQIPVALFTAPSDYFASKEDVDDLADALPNVALNQQVPLENYGFFSYFLAADAPTVLYQPTVNFLRSIGSVRV